MTKKEPEMSNEGHGLLSLPSDTTDVKFWRHDDPSYKNLSDPFVLPLRGRNFQRQYYHIYRQRLQILHEGVVQAAKSEFGADISIKSLCDLDNDDDNAKDEEVVVIGTLFKHQPLKPNILQELSEDNAIQPISNRKSKFLSPEDEIILEDELQRIKLVLEAGDKLKVSSLATGIVCGVYGRIGSKSSGNGGKFFVKNMVFPMTKNPLKLDSKNDAQFLAILSGLNLNSSGAADSMGPLELALSWLTGESGAAPDQEFMSKVQRVIVAGNALSEETKDRDEHKARYLTKNKEATSIEAINALDDVLVQLAGSVQVDLMPGPNDPANQSLPQQPLHRCLFPKTGVYESFQGVTNPYLCTLGEGIEVLGTSGQNVNDLMLTTDIEDPLDALECLLRWGHIAPTCPDSLGCYPFQDQDPFVIDRKPHIFFAANQESFNQRTVLHADGSKTLCVTVPEFSSKNQLCLINLKAMQCEIIDFQLGF